MQTYFRPVLARNPKPSLKLSIVIYDIGMRELIRLPKKKHTFLWFFSWQIIKISELVLWTGICDKPNHIHDEVLVTVIKQYLLNPLWRIAIH